MRAADGALQAIHAALVAAGLPASIRHERDLSGGCIHQVKMLELSDSSRVVAKLNRAGKLPWFEEEVHGLRALAATQTVVVPRVLATLAEGDVALLMMTFIEPASGSVANEQAWQRFGRQLAALHAAEAGERYGYEIDNHIGSTFQPNGWRDDWVEFNQVHRLGHQLKLARDAGLLNAHETKTIETIIDRLDQFIPRQPRPSLLHGDLWSGNALPAAHRGEETLAIIDPACSIGDRYADLAMMQLFGGFPEICLEAYEDEVVRRLRLGAGPNDESGFEPSTRIAVYQLYHLLNHINIFGRGYADQTIRLANKLLAGL